MHVLLRLFELCALEDSNRHREQGGEGGERGEHYTIFSVLQCVIT